MGSRSASYCAFRSINGIFFIYKVVHELQRASQMIPVILSGGSGTRLWPVSRASYPKQFCDFFDGSFLGNTIHRLKALGDIHILTTKSMEALTHRAVKREGLNSENVLLEPMG